MTPDGDRIDSRLPLGFPHTRRYASPDRRIDQPQFLAVSSMLPPEMMNGVIIGLLSSFGSAILIALVFLIVYFVLYTPSGRILLDRFGRPGEYDDEQAFAREEAEALETMDDMQRTEYLRAKGMQRKPSSHFAWHTRTDTSRCSIHPGQPARVHSDGYFPVAISCYPREGSLSMGV